MDRIRVSQLLGPGGEMFVTVFTVVRQWILIGRMTFQVVLQVILVLEPHSTLFTGEPKGMNEDLDGILS